MIPHIIHYCWFGGNLLPELEQQCLASWKKHMPDWEYMEWNESNFDIAATPLYVRQAYEARKYAFVSDYVRLWALEQYGGLYMDVDFEVFRPFDELMDKYPAFAGYEGSKRHPVMQGVIASEPHGAWVRDMLQSYQCREFIKADGSLDLTPNTSYFTDRLEAQGFVADGVEKDFYLLESKKTHINTVPAINIDKGEVTKNTHSTSAMPEGPRGPERNYPQALTSELAAPVDANTPNLLPDSSTLNAHENTSDSSDLQKTVKNGHADGGIFMLHVFPVHYFCPVLTTGEDVRTAETYCEHKGESSWAQQTWKGRLMKYLSPKWRTTLIKIKRKIVG